MASFLDKFKLNTAVDSRTKLDLSSQHITTGNFMQFNIAWSKELVPKEKITINMETFARLEPLPVPTFGRANIHNRAFFVPFRTIFPAWNDFITDTRHQFQITGSTVGASKLVNTTPIIANDVLCSFFAASSNGLTRESSTPIDDVVYQRGASDNVGLEFTPKGRQVLKVLQSLGYNLNWTYADKTKFSALPLLAVAKVYCDWYWPSNYTADQQYANLDGLFRYDSVGSLNSEYKLELGVFDLKNIFDVIGRGVNYDSDYFVSAWDNPTTPSDGSYSEMIVNGNVDSHSYELDVTSASDGEVYLGAADNMISQYSLKMLRALTDYMKRHQLVGARALDRYLARFGINLPAEKLNRSLYLGCATQGLQFGDIMSTADTDGAELGKYAGKGLSYGDGNFEFETSEYGIMIIISSIVPTVGYYQGVDRNVMHTNKLDYFTPEFDNLGVQVITANELITADNAYTGLTNAQNLPTTTFGFTPRYAEYKTGKDRLTGDFRIKTIGADDNSWHMMREVEYSTAADVRHNVGFVRGLDAGQYSRIFYNTNADDGDKFKIIHNFNITSYSPMKSMFDTYEFEDKGDKVVEDVNGVKMN